MSPKTKQTQSSDNPFNMVITPLKSKKTIAAEFDISVKTLSKRLKKANVEIPKGLICNELQLLIYQIISTK